ncbi:STAS domain-containing protein [Ruania halotolerans]|uniref:STAS domain-containing protein n=1 Tax=Ruania halotolerans TaxID=2897773 RepID=UPI001E6591E0|nr:STAS domain-containing protein [Ruania halotolerans]UFU05518.1 STAS domain-containing protein [Ruania halotolerans]
MTSAGYVWVATGESHTLLVLKGEIDRQIAPQLHEAVDIAASAGVPVYIDARDITFFDAFGIAILVRLAARTPERPMLIGAPPIVRFLLEVTAVRDLVDTCEKHHLQQPALSDHGPLAAVDSTGQQADVDARRPAN